MRRRSAPVGAGRARARCRPAASRVRPALRQRFVARRLRSARRSRVCGRRVLGRDREARLVEAGERGALALDEALGQRVGGQAVGAVQAGARGLADDVEARDGRGAVEVGDHAAHAEVRGGRDRDQLGRRVQAGLAQRADDVRERVRVDVAHVEPDVPGVLLGHLAEDGQRDLVARLELLDEALVVGVEQRRALAADRLGDQEALAARHAGHRGRVELDELQVGQRGARRVGEHHPDAERARRVGRPGPQRGGAAGRQDRRARPDRAAVLQDDADAAAVDRPRRGGAGLLEDLDARLLDDDGGELPDDAAPGRAAARVDDAALGVPALQAEREAAVLRRGRR